MPPQDAELHEWAERLQSELPVYTVVLPETDEAVGEHLPDADAVYGWVSPEQLPLAKNLKWLQNPAAGPFPGFYYPALIEHPVVACNPRGIYNDHIAHHIMMFVLAAFAWVTLLYRCPTRRGLGQGCPQKWICRPRGGNGVDRWCWGYRTRNRTTL